MLDKILLLGMSNPESRACRMLQSVPFATSPLKPGGWVAFAVRAILIDWWITSRVLVEKAASGPSEGYGRAGL